MTEPNPSPLAQALALAALLAWLAWGMLEGWL